MTLVLFDYVSVAITFVKGIALVPLYLGRFSLDIYGVWLATGNVLAIFGVVDGGLNIVFTQALAAAYGNNDRDRFVKLAGSGGVLLAAVCLVFGAATGAAVEFLPLLLRQSAVPTSVINAFRLAAIGTTFTLAQSALQAVVYAWQDTWFAGCVKITMRVVDIVTTVIGLFAGFGVVALGIGMFASGLAGCAFTSAYIIFRWHTKNLSRPVYDAAEAKSLLRTTAPVFAGRAGSIFVNNSDALLASAWVGPSAAAILALNDRAFKLASMLVNPLAGAAFPGLAHLSATTNYAKLRQVVTDLFLLSAIATAITIPVVLGVNRSFISIWVGESRYGGQLLTILLGCNAALLLRTNLLGVIVPALGDIKQASWCMIAELITRLPLAIVLMPRIGIIALPVASLMTTTMITFIFLTRLLSRRLGYSFAGGLQLQFSSTLLIAAVIAIGVGLGTLVPASGPAPWLAVRTGLVLAVMSAIALTGAIVMKGQRSLLVLTGVISQHG